MSVEKLNENQYEVTIDGHTRIAHLDGIAVVTKTDYDKLMKKGVDIQGFKFRLARDERNPYMKEAMKYQLKKEPFDVSEFLDNFIDDED